MDDTPPAWAERYAIHIRAHQLMIQEILEMLVTANPKAVSDLYGFICDRLDRDNEISSPELQKRNEEIRRYIGEVLSIIGPGAPLPI
jgi:hypothetical protein